MAWTAEKVKAMRESNPSKAAESSGWTAEKVRAIRTKTPNPSTASSTVPPKSNIYADALQQYTERHASDMGEVDARNEPSQAHSGRGENLSPFPSADAARERSSPIRGALLKGNPTERALDMGQKWGVPAKSGNVLENVGSGAMAYGTGRAQELRASFAKDSVPDEFDRINQWLDTGDNKNLADAVRRVDNTHGAYTDADLIKKGGWTQAQIDEARKMNAALDAIPAWKRDVRRVANTIGGIGDTVAAAPLLGAEYGVQAGKNIDATLKNWKQVGQEVKGDEHAQSLFDLLTDVDMDYNPTWPESRNRELISMGYNSKEIREMRQKLAGLEVSDGIDKNQSVGYQLYDRGQQLTAAAQSGLSPAQRAVSGAVTSAAENLAVAGVNPAAVLPILSAQGAAEAMGQSAEKGEGAGKALGGGLAKFGAGWAINSVGAADLAKTMGSDYAKDTLAGQIADWVQGLAGSSELAQRYPAVAAAISGGIDNSMQAFAETYADMAIDAALGDSEAAKNLFSKDTFLTALESGLSGGASGALGGAVGTGLAKLNGGDASLLGQAKYHDRMDRMERAAAQQKEWEARAAEPSQSASPTAPPEGRATGVPGSSQLDAGSAAGREMAGLATEGSGSGPAQQTLGAATREQSAFLKGNSTESMQRAEATAAKSENPAVRQFAEVAASDSLTGKTIGLFTPNAENRGNRAAFEQAYGVTLPDTAGATRRMLREIAAQQKAKSEAVPAVQSAELPSEAASAPQTVQDAPAETADAMPETAAPDNVREATAAVGETDSYENAPLRETLGLRPEAPKTQREAEVQHALEYLAKSSGYESLDEMVRAKLEDYSAQSLTYEQAAEELVADAWRGIFDSEESFKRWVTFQRGQAEKNAGKSGAIHKVMEQVRQMLDGLISRAKEVLTINPDNRAALKAKRLAEAEKRTLQDEYFAHAEKAMDNLRTAKENAAALKTESAAEKQGVRFSILKDKTGESYIKIDEDILKDVPQEEWKSTVKQAIKERFPNGFERNGWTILNHKDGRNEFVWSKSTKALQWENAEAYADKMRMAANLDEIIRTADEVYREPANHKNAEAFNRGKIKIQVGQNVYEADVLTAIKTDQREIFYDIVDIKPIKIETSGKAHIESEDSRSSGPEVSVEASGGTHVESEDSRSRLPEASKQSIAQTSDESKRTDEPVKKTVRFQLSESRRNQSELQKESRELERQRRALKEERANWQESNEVRAIEEKKKAYGLFSEKGKAFRASEEYQSYLEKRKEFNRRGAELESRIGEVNDKLRQAQAEVENARQAVKQEQQKVYDTKAKAAGGKPEYRRKLAVEQFGTTDRFEQAGYILPDGRMLDFAQNDSTRDTDHREILGVFGPAEVSNGTEALNEFLADGNVRVMAEAPGVDIAAKTPPTEQQLKQIRAMVEQLGSEKRRFTLDISTTDGRVAASKEYSGKVDADKVVREIREYYKTGELPAESELARFRYQRAEQADREAKQNQQRQASRVLAEKAAAFDTLNQFFGLTKNTRLSDAALESLAIRWTKTNGSRADRTKLANETRALVEYLRSEGADMAKAQGLAETLAGEVLDEATYRNTELWNQYPDLHDLTYTVDKNGKAKAELVKRYGSWTEAVAEARRHGVKLRQAEGYRDGNPAEQYEAIVNDTRAVGGVKESAAALFRSAAQEAGVAGAASMKSTEWLDVLMNVHDTIKPKMMSRFADVAEYEDAKVELAGRMIGDIMSHPEMTDAEAVFEGILKHNREVAAMAAGSEERAAEVTKGLKSVQQTQRKAFADRMRENSRSQSAEVKSVSRAERQLNENLETLGAQVSTAAGLDEKMTALREAYEREWKAEKSRMKQARQEMLDEIKLERQQLRSQINDLSRQVAGEQKRADRAEHQLLVQENEIMEWEAENQRKAEAWQEKQAQRNAIAIETARQQRDEDVAVAKALAEKRVQKAREGRKADELKRSIRNNAAQLRQMLLRPKPGKYVQKSLIVQAAEVAKLADMVVLNSNALTKLTALQDSIRRSGEMDVGIHADWENSGVEKLIQTLRDDMNASKQAKLDRLRQQLEEAKALPDGDKAEQLRDRLRQRIRETENRTYLPMTVDQLRMLKAITASTLHIIRTENKTLSLARAEEVDSMAMKAAREVLNSEGNGFGEKFEKAKGAMNRYQLDMLGGTRMFRRLGGYTKNGQMEKLGQMLNDGQRRQTEILVEGESLFANVTGKEHLKEVEAFAGPGAELVDIGLKDSKGNAVPLNHAQLCSLYMLLRNKDSRHHLMTGGLTLPDAAQYAKGNIERAYQRSQTVMLGTLVNADGTPMDDTILQTVQDAMTDYDRNWCKDMEDFFGRYTTNLINETSMKLLGYDRATVKNYYPIAVDRSTLATEIEGVKMDATIEGRGFLKERVKSDKPILLEECQNVVKRSLRDTAAYAGLAAPIRDVQRVLNSTVETAEGIGVLKDKIIGEKWGKETVSYINDLLTDLQTTRRKRSSTMSRALDRMRGNYAGAILTVNPGVAIAQAASLPTAGAVLGADTMAAVLPFVKNFSGKQRAAVEAEIRQHGDALLQYRLRGTKRGEMSSIGAHKNLVAKASEAMPAVTGWITGMDEITVAALWEGSKRYVERHAAEFGEGAAEKGSEAYWEAVNKMYQRVIEETQPNYTTMQRAGIQRSDNEFVKTLTMFTTQRFQNYGILADAVGDYKAQKARYAADQSAENKAEVQRAGQGLRQAAASQVVQTAVFALMKIGADFLLHRWDREQDKNGDVTAKSLGKRFFDLYTESAAGNFLYGSEIYSALTNARDGKDYDVVSATNISAVNDLFAAFTKTVKLLRTDTGEMSEEELTAHHQKLNKAVLKDIQCGLELYGVPAANIRKVMQAFEGYWEDAQAIGRGEGFSFNSAPSSATGQYDRLYNAIQSGDSEEAAAAMKKLEQMNKTDKVDGELARRLKQYDADVLAAAEARNAGKTRAEEKARKAVFEKLREGLDVAPVTDRAKGKADAARRAQLIDLVNKAVDGKADELLAGGKDGSIYDALLDEVKNGRVEDAQEELDRLMTAGKDKGSIKSKITESVKEEYLAGSDRDREKLEKKLLALEDADENPLYEEKNFAQWVSAADKKAEKTKDERNWWEEVK